MRILRRFPCSFTRFTLVSSLLATALLPGRWAAAQYQVHSWANFEDQRFPPNYAPIGAFSQTAQLVKYSDVPNAPAGLWSPALNREIGQFGLRLRADPQLFITGLGMGVILDRDKLGARGRALYQADLFIPDAAQPLPSLGVLAMDVMQPGETEPKTLYRFGLTKNRDLYFSYVFRGSNEAKVYKFDRTMPTQIPRPGWHRFQIVFEGPSTIRCFIDGREAPVSPIAEPTVRQLQVGLMLADNEASYLCFADNLSIQWTPEDAPLPDSPYAASWGDAPSAPPTIATSPQPNTAPIQWLDPNAAWQRSQDTQMPMLVCFYAPRVAATADLNQVMSGNAGAQAFLRRHTLAAIDVNQLQGGTVAQKFSVYRVPTLIVLTPQMQEVARATYQRGETWEALEERLKPAVAPAQAPGARPGAAAPPTPR